jgi:hypothetical protein
VKAAKPVKLRAAELAGSEGQSVEYDGSGIAKSARVGNSYAKKSGKSASNGPFVDTGS